MEPEWLVIARDASIIFLALQWFVILAVVLIANWYICRGAIQLLHKVEAGFVFLRALHARLIATIYRALAAIQAPFIWIQSNMACVQTFMTTLKRPGLRGR